MGELSKADAERLRNNYIKDTVRVCTQAKSRLNGMMFLAAEDYE